jgi:hypothetical protein
MPRIDTHDKTKKWRYTCPSPARHHNWRVVDGLIECRSCGETYSALVDTETGERIPREDLEIVGPHADSKLAFGDPAVPEGGDGP